MRALEIPDVLQHEGVALLLILITDDVSRVGSGDAHDFGAHVGD
jgi:hypothetical protein